MTETEARDAAARIVSSWSLSGVSLDTWVEELRPLDAGTAGTALVRLRRELERPPSIARFHAMYRSLRTATTDPTPDSTCTACGGCGWINAPDFVVGEGEHEHHYSQVQPCPRCPAGDHARNVHTTIARTNGWTPALPGRSAPLTAPSTPELF